jgi:hypothetical protein
MDARRLLILTAVVVTALAALPAAASAKNVPMRGVVSGSPYGASNGQMAIPVLFSKQTASAAGLKSPVGVIIVKRTLKVKLPGSASTLPVNLRTGDRFKGVGQITPTQQRVAYPRVVFSNVIVYFRSKALSLTELSVAVQSLTQTVDSLNIPAGVDLSGIQAQIDALKAALAALKIPPGVDLTNIQSQLDALSKKLNDLIASLPDFSKFALVSQLPDLSQYATLTDLSNAIAGLATKSYVDSAIAGLQTQINGLPTNGDVTTIVNNALTNYATKTYVDNAVGALKTRLDNLCTSLKTATVAIDPDGAGPLPTVTVPVTLPSIATPCP